MTPRIDAVAIAAAEERLRQEKALFDRRLEQDRWVFRLRQVIGWATVGLFVLISALCAYIILNHVAFSATTVGAATTALLVETLGLLVAVIKGVVGKGPAELKPTTSESVLPTPNSIRPATAHNRTTRRNIQDSSETALPSDGGSTNVPS